MGFRAVLHRADVVHIEDVDPRQPEPLQAVLERAHDPVIGVVVDGLERQRIAAFRVRGRGPARTQQASDFCRQYPFVARDPAHCIADATLGLADTVIGRRVDVAHPGRPGGARRSPRPSCRETSMRLPPSVAQPRPSAVTSTEVRPILRFSKAGIACSPAVVVRPEHTPFAAWSRRRRAAVCARNTRQMGITGERDTDSVVQ